jgi:hypothetical protein
MADAGYPRRVANDPSAARRAWPLNVPMKLTLAKVSCGVILLQRAIMTPGSASLAMYFEHKEPARVLRQESNYPLTDKNVARHA